MSLLDAFMPAIIVVAVVLVAWLMSKPWNKEINFDPFTVKGKKYYDS